MLLISTCDLFSDKTLLVAQENSIMQKCEEYKKMFKLAQNPLGKRKKEWKKKD